MKWFQIFSAMPPGSSEIASVVNNDGNSSQPISSQPIKLSSIDLGSQLSACCPSYNSWLRPVHRYLMEKLELYPQYDPKDLAKPTNTTLHQFENALANMAASMYWGGILVYPISTIFKLTRHYQLAMCNLIPGFNRQSAAHLTPILACRCSMVWPGFQAQRHTSMYVILSYLRRTTTKPRLFYRSIFLL